MRVPLLPLMENYGLIFWDTDTVFEILTRVLMSKDDWGRGNSALWI
jgi:hypothetical protein